MNKVTWFSHATTVKWTKLHVSSMQQHSNEHSYMVLAYSNTQMNKVTCFSHTTTLKWTKLHGSRMQQQSNQQNYMFLACNNTQMNIVTWFSHSITFKWTRLHSSRLQSHSNEQSYFCSFIGPNVVGQGAQVLACRKIKSYKEKAARTIVQSR